MLFIRTCVRKVLILHIFRVRRKFLQSSYIDSSINLNSSRTTLIRTTLGRRLVNPWTTLGRPSDDPWTTLGRLLDNPRMTLGWPSDDPRMTRGRPSDDPRSTSQMIDLITTIHSVQKSSKSELSSATFGHFKVSTNCVKHKNFRTRARITGSSYATSHLLSWK